MKVALGIPDRPISTEMILDCLEHNESDSVVLPPATLEEMSQDEKSINMLKKMSFVGFGGGKSDRKTKDIYHRCPLPVADDTENTGNLAPESGHLMVKKGIKLMNFIAATEYAPNPDIFCYLHRN